MHLTTPWPESPISDHSLTGVSWRVAALAGALVLAGAGCNSLAQGEPANLAGPVPPRTRVGATQAIQPVASARGGHRPLGRQGPSCPARIYREMSPAQRVGQLFLIGLSSQQPMSGDDGVIRAGHVGGVLLDGPGWDGAIHIRQATQHLQGVAAQATMRVRLWVAGNQEGGVEGSLQAFYGPGFSRIPPGIAQGQLPPARLDKDAQTWGHQLKEAGVNLDLAPVADVVPATSAPSNGAIGRYGRELGHQPAEVASHVRAVVRGLLASGVQPTLKHFPGLGRVPDNTDTSAVGITDPFMTTHDPDLEPFKAGIRAGAPAIMVSLARYPRLDPRHQAVFSPAIMMGLLRHRLGFGGMIVSDDLGSAVAVASLSPAQRAVRFLAAGGDVVLTSSPAEALSMETAVFHLASRHPGFSRLVFAAVRHVLAAKERAHLLPCR
jgi:beta-N-acetylhexosaminidase